MLFGDEALLLYFGFQAAFGVRWLKRFQAALDRYLGGFDFQAALGFQAA